MKTIGIGVIGWGFMGRMHTHALKSLSLMYPGADFRVRLVSVCSRRIDAAREAAEREGFLRYTDDYHKLVNDRDVDVVSICSPNALHEEMALAALKAGKRIYIDKPLTTSCESALRIVEAAREAGVQTHMVMNNRYTPALLRAKALAEEGRLGTVLSAQARYLHSGSIDPDKPVGWKQLGQGGALLDLGSHALDLLTFLAGWPTEVLCATRTLYPERPTASGGTTRDLSEDQALIWLRLENGALATVEASKIATGTNDDFTLEVRGDKGAITWDAMQPNYLGFYDATLPETALGGARGFTAIETVGRYPAPGGVFPPSKNALGWDRGHIHCYYSFLDAVAHDRPSLCGVEEGAKLVKLMEAAKRSAETGAWVSLT